MLKTAGIPIWVTIFLLIVLATGCSSGLMAMIGQDMEGLNKYMSFSWGGRSIGLGIAAGLAVFLRSPTTYLVVLVGGLGRDIGDLIAHFGKPEPSMGVMVGIILFLIAGVAGVIAANKARNL